MKLVVYRKQRRRLLIQTSKNVSSQSHIQKCTVIKDIVFIKWILLMYVCQVTQRSTKMNVHIAVVTVVTGSQGFSYCLYTQESFQDEFWQDFVDVGPSQRKFGGPVPAQSYVYKRNINGYIAVSQLMGK